LDAVQSFIIATASAGSISFTGNGDSLGPSTSDLLYVAASVNLTLQSGAGVLTIDMPTPATLKVFPALYTFEIAMIELPPR
jgi:hypothetical protein